MADVDPKGFEGPLAEFVALRQEIDRRSTNQQGILTLQLTVAGAVFSFALSEASRIGVLLILPISTYMLCGRYVSNYIAIRNIAEYIKGDLCDRVPGGLHWQRWVDERPFHLRELSWVNPLMVTFPGVSFLSLAWTPGYLLDGMSLPILGRVGVWLVWALGVVAAMVSARQVWQMIAKYRRYQRL